MNIEAWIAFAGLLVTVVGALLGFAWRIATVTERVRSNAARIAQIEAGDRGSAVDIGALATQLAEFRGAFIARIEGLVDRMAEMRSDMTWLRQTALYELETKPDSLAPRPPARRRAGE